MNAVSQFKDEKEQVIKLLERVQEFLNEGESLGLKLEDSVKEKISKTINDVNSEKLRVVLVGGFSEGKTSIVASWLERLDKSTMNIAEVESSSKIEKYELEGEPITIIDTPGLFGFKQLTNEEAAKIEKYKEITRKYVSEAHIVLYVMNSSNPIKESHSAELKWLFRDLNLLARTIFVLSRFDEVADVEDEMEYEHNLKIKKENVISRLKNVISLTENEEKEISIVAVAANPFGLGTENWLKEIEKFKRLSHIGLLQEATANIIKKNGSIDSIVLETQKSVIKDCLIKKLPEIENKNNEIFKSLEALEKSQARSMGDIEIFRGKMKTAKKELQDNIMSYFSGLRQKVRGCSIETLPDFLKNEIGEEGCILNTRLKQYFDEATEVVDITFEKMEVKLSGEIAHYNTLMQAGKFVANNIKFSNTGIITARNFLNLPLKFKPWGALKLAKGLNGALAGLGLALEVVDSVNNWMKEDDFRQAVNEMDSKFANQQKDLLELIDCPNFERDFFPRYVVFEENLNNMQEEIKRQKDQSHSFLVWKEKGEALEKDLKFLEANKL